MTAISYFISDFGFGHASRSIAIMRSLLECDLDVTIDIYTSNPLDYVTKAFSSSLFIDRLKFNRVQNDGGKCCKQKKCVELYTK